MKTKEAWKDENRVCSCQSTYTESEELEIEKCIDNIEEKGGKIEK